MHGQAHAGTGAGGCTQAGEGVWAGGQVQVGRDGPASVDRQAQAGRHRWVQMQMGMCRQCG